MIRGMLSSCPIFKSIPLKCRLLFFDELHDKPRKERNRRRYDQDPAGKPSDACLPVCNINNTEHDEIGTRLVEHCRMSRHAINSEKDDGARQVGRDAETFRVKNNYQYG